MLKYYCRFAADSGQVEGIFHEEEDVNVIRLSFGSDERAEHRHSRYLPSRGSKLVESG
jgi:hypothetical protein